MPVLDVVFPPRCVACGRQGWPLCGGCAPDVGVVVAPICSRCGRPTEEIVASCSESPPPHVATVRAPFVYDGPVATAIRGMKFSGWRALGPYLASAMATVVRPDDVEAVTWVPLSRRRRARRGFDQAEVLARAVARRLELPASRLLVRRRNTAEQARRGARDRRYALRGVFGAAGPSPTSVLLVDDVLTTGSTAAACASALRSAGAWTVHVLVAARALRDGAPARCYGRGSPVFASLR